MAKIEEVVQRCNLPFAFHHHVVPAVGNPFIRERLHNIFRLEQAGKIL